MRFAMPIKAVLLSVLLGISACGNADDSGTDSDTGDFNQDCTAFVDGEVEESGDGWSWESAVKTVQEGIDLAHYGATEVGICDQWEVWVKQGTYYIYQDSRENTVQLKENTALLGGFDGSETAEFDRDWEANVTILDGREGFEGKNHVYHVVTGVDEATLDGFTITGGKADEKLFDSPHSRGGGMTIGFSSPVVKNCLFESNSASISGGGIYILDGSLEIGDSSFSNNTAIAGGAIGIIRSSVNINNVEFVNNKALGAGNNPHFDLCAGGAVYFEKSEGVLENCDFANNTAYNLGGGIGAEESDIFLEGCEFRKNYSTGYGSSGGGLYLGSSSNVEIFDAIFDGNVAAMGGGLRCQTNSTVDIANALFVDNVSSTEGGGIDIVFDSTAAVIGCNFENNSSGAGGGMFIWQATAQVSETVFDGNSALEGGAGACNAFRNATFTNCLFTNNNSSKGMGGGVLGWGGATELVNCTFSDNSAQLGGAVYSSSYQGNEDNITIVNSILWDDSTVEIEWDVNSPTVTFSVVEGGYKGEENIDLDPLFVDPAAGDFHLQSGSPCIGAASAEAAPKTDFDGNPRDDEPDMGAYEVQ